MRDCLCLWFVVGQVVRKVVPTPYPRGNQAPSPYVVKLGESKSVLPDIHKTKDKDTRRERHAEGLRYARTGRKDGTSKMPGMLLCFPKTKKAYRVVVPSITPQSKDPVEDLALRSGDRRVTYRCCFFGG